MPTFNIDLCDGLPPVTFVLKPQDAERFMVFMAECQALKEQSGDPMFDGRSLLDEDEDD